MSIGQDRCLRALAASGLSSELEWHAHGICDITWHDIQSQPCNRIKMDRFSNDFSKEYPNSTKSIQKVLEKSRPLKQREDSDRKIAEPAAAIHSEFQAWNPGSSSMTSKRKVASGVAVGVGVVISLIFTKGGRQLLSCSKQGLLLLQDFLSTWHGLPEQGDDATVLPQESEAAGVDPSAALLATGSAVGQEVDAESTIAECSPSGSSESFQRRLDSTERPRRTDQPLSLKAASFDVDATSRESFEYTISHKFSLDNHAGSPRPVNTPTGNSEQLNTMLSDDESMTPLSQVQTPRGGKKTAATDWQTIHTPMWLPSPVSDSEEGSPADSTNAAPSLPTQVQSEDYAL
ncbi:hypothetical protein CYMTET_16483 [Cymbomonas tetramitiformis]|uniref:Uncharacterized protein n=1 Tax=Cymbomonas tetramitiformis TaxID=36881 RepID=A0AAE0L7W0_9CHLO|nr:hypothetical protein CYMTET_16483 [Cymbomonas tetramitiformis]